MLIINIPVLVTCFNDDKIVKIYFFNYKKNNCLLKTELCFVEMKSSGWKYEWNTMLDFPSMLGKLPATKNFTKMIGKN